MTVMSSDPHDPKVQLIQEAATVIVRAQQEPHSAPGHWAGALWEHGLLRPRVEAVPEMSVAEAAQRDRVRDDVATRIVVRRLATSHFGGDLQRMAWFLDEFAKGQE